MFNGTKWENVSSPRFSAGKASYTSLAIDDYGRLYVAYKEDDLDPSKATVMKGYGTQKRTFRSQASNDGWVLESGENTNKGGSLNKTGNLLRLGDSIQNKQYRSILSFNTKSLPKKAVITNMKLKIKRKGVIGNGEPDVKLEGFMVDIMKGFFHTSPDLQRVDFQALPTTNYYTTGPLTPPLVKGWYNFHLTYLQNYINKLANNGGVTQIRLRFKLDDNNNNKANQLLLYSGNAGKAKRPKLIVKYYVP
jgi:hypothetical protein